MDWGRKWFVDFNAGKKICLTDLLTLVLLMWKWIEPFLRKNQLLRCWGCLSVLNWIRALTLSLLLKLHPRKLEPWFVLRICFLLRLVCISTNVPYSLAWNTVVMSRLVLLATGLAKMKKLVMWSPRTFFCIKARGSEILKIGEKKYRFHHSKAYSDLTKHLR